MFKRTESRDRDNQPHIAIVGTGFAGLGMAIRLKQSGHHNFTIFERGSTLGGTWRDNTYPGAACDVQSFVYSFSFEPSAEWSRMFAEQAEILAYMKRCAEKHDLYRHIQFDTSVDAARFDESTALWTLELSTGASHQATFMIAGCGPLNRPSFPSIEGLGSFEGPVFHTSEWDHDVNLTGKRVGVIGTGASAIQAVPAIAPKVESLTVFQRTPPWITPKRDRAIGPIEKALYRRAPGLLRLQRLRLYWELEARAVGFVSNPGILRALSNLVKLHLRFSVQDEELRKKVTPDYTMGCKRILVSNDYYPALERDNVELTTESVSQITPAGVVTSDGELREFDVLIFATGFQASEDVAPFDIHGRDGRRLSDDWDPYAESYLGTSVAGYPNMFLLIGPNTGLGHNSMIFMMESQFEYILQGVAAVDDAGARYLDVRQSIQDAYNKQLQQRMRGTVWNTGCTSWYQTSDGRNTTLWPGYTCEYRLRMSRFEPGDYQFADARSDASSVGVVRRVRSLLGV